MRPAERIAEREQFARGFRVHVGVDAGKSFHKMVASGPDRVRTKAVRVDVTREGFESALTFLRAQFPDVAPEQALVAIEFAGHYGYTFADFLRARGFVIVTMPSIVTKRLKEIEDNSPRKDDAKDAAQICKLVGAGLFVSYATLTPLVAQLRVLATERHRLAVEETRMRIRLHAILDLAWPEFTTQFPPPRGRNATGAAPALAGGRGCRGRAPANRVRPVETRLAESLQAGQGEGVLLSGPKRVSRS